MPGWNCAPQRTAFQQRAGQEVMDLEAYSVLSVRAAGARTCMHPLDTPMAESGSPFRPMTPAPGRLRRVTCKLLFHPNERVAPVAIDQPLTAGEILPIAVGVEVIPTPGHCAGQVALLWRLGRMLFAGEVCMNIIGLGDPVGFERVWR